MFPDCVLTNRPNQTNALAGKIGSALHCQRSPRALVYLSGAAELACAAGLVVPRMRRLAGWATAALFVAVFPGNVQMALDAADRSELYRAATYARLPVQVPLVAWAVQVARFSRRSSG